MRACDYHTLTRSKVKRRGIDRVITSVDELSIGGWSTARQDNIAIGILDGKAEATTLLSVDPRQPERDIVSGILDIVGEGPRSRCVVISDVIGIAVVVSRSC